MESLVNEIDIYPTLQTERLILRPFDLSDARKVQELAGHSAVAATTATVPHPYPDGAAEAWIERHAEWFRNRSAVEFAIVLKQTEELIGCIDLLAISQTSSKGELAYWIGVPYWNKGYCSEAAKALLKYGFQNLRLNKITSRHMAINPASGRVMLKCGLKKEGILRQEFRKNGQFLDMEVYGILRDEFNLKPEN